MAKRRRRVTIRKVASNDIVKLILEDHKPLKKFIKIMKDGKVTYLTRRKAFGEFARLLFTHTKAEEYALYEYFLGQKEFRQKGFEGQVEHRLAEQIMLEAENALDKDLVSSRIRVLAELMEHHLKEEEGTVLPQFLRRSDPDTRIEIGDRYLQRKVQLDSAAEGSDDAPKRQSDEAPEKQISR